MKYVILRDDDTNALTPIHCLERLYRPFLDRGFPVNLATIPNVHAHARRFDGKAELFVMEKNRNTPPFVPIGSNPKLVQYLKDNDGFKILQHGCRHDFIRSKTEFEQEERAEIIARLEEGARFLREAGFAQPATFVAPYDRISRTGFEEISKRFRVISTGWYELKRIPYQWIPRYALKKIFRQSHWSVGGTFLLTHPGCHLSCHHPRQTMLDIVKRSIDSRNLTVLVTHWWEYFREQTADDAFISVLHETAEYLATRRDIRVIAFDDLTKGNIVLN